MAKKFLVGLDLNANELQNAVIQNLASQPTGVKGRIYYDSATNKFRMFFGDGEGELGWQNIAIGNQAASTVTLQGDVAGTANVVNGVITIDTTVQANSVALGTDTTGDYVENVTGGTGVTITGTKGEGWNPTIAIGQDVATTSSVSFAGLTLSGDAAVNGGDVTTTSTTASLFNANATTLNIGGAGTTISIGAATGTTTVNNDFVSAGDIAANGGDLTTTATTASLFNANATTLNIGGAATTISIGAATGNTTVNNNLVVSGNLTVEGETTTLNTATLLVEDNIIVLNKNVTGVPSLNAGITIERGDEADVSILWNETSNTWTLTNDGTNYHSVVRKHVTELVGDALEDEFTVTHNLGSREVQVEVYDSAAPYDTVEVDVERTTTTAVTIRFAVPPIVGKNYKVVVVG